MEKVKMPVMACNCEVCELKNTFIQFVQNTELDKICHIKVEKAYKTGDVVVKQGEEIKDFSYLKEGLLKIFRIGSTGKEQIISIAKPLDFVNLLSIFSDKYYNYSVAALTDSVVCSIKLSEVKRLASTNGDFAMNILEKMSRVSDKIIIETLEIRQRHVYGRVAFMLLYFSNHIYNSDIYDLPVTRKEIAEFIGVTTENVIRAMSTFREDKIIKINGKSIEIIDKPRLSKISEMS
jgi:CRP-like cAMP-binding protein